MLLVPIAALAADDRGRLAPPEPKVFALKLEKGTAAQALTELGHQSGTVVEDRTGATISLDLPKTAFWPALDAIARAAHARVDLYGRDGRLAIVRQPAGYVEPPVSYSSAFRTTVKRMTASRDLESGTVTNTATLEVAWEPSLQPLFLETSPRSLVVRDEQGRRLQMPAEGSVMAPVDGRLAKEFDIPLPQQNRSATKIPQLDGRLTAIVPTKMVAFQFDQLDRLAAAGADAPLRRQEQDGVACRLSRVQLSRDRWTIQVALEYPPGGVKLESYQSRVANNELVLESRDGRSRMTPSGYAIDSIADGRAKITYHFLDSDKPSLEKPSDWRLRYRTPVALVEMPFSFSFKDLPLP
jgi:hypothetical protein